MFAEQAHPKRTAPSKAAAGNRVDRTLYTDIHHYLPGALLPKVDRTMKVPASMMLGSWMGSHFTNDDLMREIERLP